MKSNCANVDCKKSVCPNNDCKNKNIENKGQHNPIVVARAVVVVECMTALVLADALLVGMSAKLDNVMKVRALDEK